VAKKKKKPAELEVNLGAMVTPMLDMSFQLLSFFVITFRPMPTEGQMAINMPKLDAAESQQEISPPEDKKDEYTVTVHSTAGGDVALLGLKGPTLNSENITKTQDLLNQLNAIPKPAGRGKEGISITIQAANDLHYSKLIEIMDLCKKAGYESVNLMPLAKGGS
jgi:biopolymer transport protein ExbD